MQTFSVGSATPSLSVQTINFTSTPPASAIVGGPGYALAATATSGLSVVFSAAASSVGICTVTGSTVALLGAGTCTIVADQSGSTAYAPAAQVQQSFSIALAAQAITFTSVPPGSGCGRRHRLHNRGRCILWADGDIQPRSCEQRYLLGHGRRRVALGGRDVHDLQTLAMRRTRPQAGSPRASRSVQVQASTSPQTISFTTAAPAAAATSGTTRPLRPASSGLPITYAVAPTSAGVCVLSGGVVSLVGTGTCRVLADQAGNASYDPAPQASQSFGVSPPPLALQTIAFTSPAPAAAVYGGALYAVAATASSGLPVAFSTPASSNGICTVSGSTVSLVGGGTCTISANQTGNGSYAPAPQAQQSFTVARAAQTITITSTPPPVDKHSPPYTIVATATSGLAVSFSVAAESSTICSVSGASVTFLKRATASSTQTRAAARSICRRRKRSRRSWCSRMRDPGTRVTQAGDVPRSRSVDASPMTLSQPRTFRLSTSPVARYASLVFLLAAGLIGTVTFALDRSARSSTWREHSVALAGGAQVGASSFESLHTSLRIEATQMATSLSLQRAIVQHDDIALRRIAAARHARIDLGGRSIGSLPSGQRIVSTASITDGAHRLATVSLAIPLDGRVVTLLRRATPLPSCRLLAHAQRRRARRRAGGAPVAIARAKCHCGRRSSRPICVIEGDATRARRGRAGVLHRRPLGAVPPAALARCGCHAVARRVRRAANRAATRCDRRRHRPPLSRQAHTDAMTGLANRRELTARLHDELERAARNETSLSFLVVDVDDFKSINDGHGHQAGDEAIKAVASLLAGSVRETIWRCRFGGEEFVVLLPGARMKNAKATAEKLRLAIEALEVRIGAGVTIRLTASFGIAEFPTYATADALFSAADSALYQAKRAGKNRVATATVQRASSTTRRSAPAAAPSARRGRSRRDQRPDEIMRPCR